MGKTVVNLGEIVCPVCNRVGRLQKFRIRRKNIYTGEYYYSPWYFRVTHYKGNKIKLLDTDWCKSGFVGEYDYQCYLGKHYP